MLWTVRHASIGSIIANYKILQDALEEISQDMMNMLLRQVEWLFFSASDQLRSIYSQ